MELTPTKNTLVPRDFDSFLDGYVADAFHLADPIFQRTMGDIQYLPGNKLKLNLETIDLGEVPSTSSILTTSTGIQLDVSNLVADVYSVKKMISGTTIAFSSLSKTILYDPPHVQLALKFDSEGTQADVFEEYEGELYMKLFHFDHESEVVVSKYTKGYESSNFNFSFHTKSGVTESRDFKLPILNGHIVWFDGLLVRLCLGTMLVYSLYDTAHPPRGIGVIWLGEMGEVRISPDQRFVIVYDEDVRVSKVWDLKENVHYYIPEALREKISMVGLSEGELKVYTFDDEFLKNQFPEANVDFSQYKSHAERLPMTLSSHTIFEARIVNQKWVRYVRFKRTLVVMAVGAAAFFVCLYQDLAYGYAVSGTLFFAWILFSQEYE